MYDLVVIGGGPAGCAAAITAVRAGADVLLLEAGDYPRQKVCGEFISPDACRLLRNLIGEFLPLARCPRISRARIYIDNQVLETEIHPAALSVARFELDAALWAAAACAGVETRLQTAVEEVEGTAPYHVRTRTERLLATSVINASGRWSKLNAQPQVASCAAIGIKAHFRESEPASTVDLYFFPGGYCGVSPVIGGDGSDACVLNVSAMVDRRKGASFADVFSRNHDLWRRSRGWHPVTQTITTYPLSFRKPFPLDGKILLAGDSAGFIDPFVGDGIAVALHTGVMASQALAPFWQGERTLTGAAEEYRREYEAHIAPCFRVAARIRRLLSLPRVLRWPLTRLVQMTRWTPQFLKATRPGAGSSDPEKKNKIAA
jgi:menaquinone-9 beta-reductase